MLPLPRAADVILWGAVVAAEAVALLGALLLARRCSLRRWFLHPDTFIPACDGAHVVVMLCAYALADEVLLAAPVSLPSVAVVSSLPPHASPRTASSHVCRK